MKSSESSSFSQTDQANLKETTPLLFSAILWVPIKEEKKIIERYKDEENKLKIQFSKIEEELLPKIVDACCLQNKDDLLNKLKTQPSLLEEIINKYLVSENAQKIGSQYKQHKNEFDQKYGKFQKNKLEELDQLNKKYFENMFNSISLEDKLILLDQCDENNMGILDHASKKGYKLTMVYLMQQGACPYLVHYHQDKSALHILIEHNQLELLKLALSMLKDKQEGLQVCSKKKQNLFHTAVLYNQLEIAEYLLSEGIDYRLKDIDGNNAFHYVVKGNNCKEILKKVLFKLPIKTNEINDEGYSPLACAIISGKTDITSIFVNNGISLGDNFEKVYSYVKNNKKIELLDDLQNSVSIQFFPKLLNLRHQLKPFSEEQIEEARIVEHAISGQNKFFAKKENQTSNIQQFGVWQKEKCAEITSELKTFSLDK